MNENFEKQIQERLQDITNSYGQIELDKIEGARMLLRNAEHHVIDYEYKGKRYYNPLNKDYQLHQFRRRVVRSLLDSYFEDKKEATNWWMSKVPLSYVAKYGNYGDSNWTMKWHDKKKGLAESVEPIQPPNKLFRNNKY